MLIYQTNINIVRQTGNRLLDGKEVGLEVNASPYRQHDEDKAPGDVTKLNVLKNNSEQLNQTDIHNEIKLK